MTIKQLSAQSEHPRNVLKTISTLMALTAAVLLLAVVPAGAQTAASPSAIPNTICISCGGGGTGGGGGGGTNYNISWAAPYTTYSEELGGVYDRQGPAAAVYNGALWMAYTSVNNPYGDQWGDDYVYVGNSNSGVPWTPTAPVNPSGGLAISNVNPALMGFGPNLYLALNTGGQYPAFVPYNSGSGWGVVTGVISEDVDYSPSLAYDPTNNVMYMGYRNSSDQTLVLCKMDSTQAITCNNFPGTTQMNFNPGMAVMNGVLYIGFEAYDNSHQLLFYKSTDQGQTITLSTAAGTDTTSTAPSLMVRTINNVQVLYFGFRSNDSGHYFLYKYTTDGANFSNTVNTGITMGGAPMLVWDQDNGGMSYNGYPPSQPYIYNLFSQNDIDHYLYESLGQ